jgi:hypothetical protein
MVNIVPILAAYANLNNLHRRNEAIIYNKRTSQVDSLCSLPQKNKQIIDDNNNKIQVKKEQVIKPKKLKGCCIVQ